MASVSSILSFDIATNSPQQPWKGQAEGRRGPIRFSLSGQSAFVPEAKQGPEATQTLDQQKRKKREAIEPPALFVLRKSEAQLQRELHNPRGLAYRNDRSGRWCRRRRAAYPPKG